MLKRSAAPAVGLAAAIAVLAGLAACDQAQSTAPAARSPRADVVSPPQSHGALVFTDDQAVYFFTLDTDHELLSAHLPLDFCTGGGLNVGARLVVATPSQIEQRLVKIQDGDSEVAIYHATSFDGLNADLCGFLLGPDKVAEGTVRHTQTFTNASFAAHWGGDVEGADGSSMHLSETYQLTASALDPNNPAYWSENVSKILLSPRP